MKEDVIGAKRRELKISVRDVPLCLMSALRRCVMRDVQTLGVQSVRIIENHTNFWDEYVAHRIALLPYEGSPSVVTLHIIGTQDVAHSVYSDAITGRDAKCAVTMAPIITLLKDQSVHLQATLTMASGKQHARFMPGLCWLTEEEGDVTTLHIEARDGVDAIETLRDALSAVRRVIDKMTAYTTLHPSNVQA